MGRNYPMTRGCLGLMWTWQSFHKVLPTGTTVPIFPPWKSGKLQPRSFPYLLTSGRGATHPTHHMGNVCGKRVLLSWESSQAWTRRVRWWRVQPPSFHFNGSSADEEDVEGTEDSLSYFTRTFTHYSGSDRCIGPQILPSLRTSLRFTPY